MFNYFTGGFTTYRVDSFVDGSCLGNPGPAGIGIVLKCGDYRKEVSMSIGHATNNIAELKAVIEGLKLLKTPEQSEVVIYTDSQLVEGFIMKQWKPKENQLLVEYMRLLLGECAGFSVVKVKGHSGIPENEICHRLAQNAARQVDNEAPTEMVCFEC